MNQIMALRGPATNAGSSPPTGAAGMPSELPIRIDIRLLSACAEIRQEWCDLAARTLEPNLFFEPEFLLAASQHLIAFRDACAILVWQGEAGDARRRLVGFIPCFPRNRLFLPEQLIGLSDARILNGAPLLDARQAQAVIAAVLSLRRGWELLGRGLMLRRVDLDSPLVTPLLRAAEQLSLSATLHPMVRPPVAADAAPDIEARRRSLAELGKLALVEASSRSDLRDHVELLLALDASGQRGRLGRALLQDAREVAFLRAMTRGLAGSRQCRVSLLTLDGRPIAGALVLGRSRRGWLHMLSHDETYAAFAPERILLAMMQQAAPTREILHPGLPACAGFGDLDLTPRAALRPRDLAGRARAALQRGFRLPRAGHA